MDNDDDHGDDDDDNDDEDDDDGTVLRRETSRKILKMVPSFPFCFLFSVSLLASDRNLFPKAISPFLTFSRLSSHFLQLERAQEA